MVTYPAPNTRSEMSPGTDFRGPSVSTWIGDPWTSERIDFAEYSVAAETAVKPVSQLAA